jgi:hypothetical protein
VDQLLNNLKDLEEFEYIEDWKVIDERHFDFETCNVYMCLLLLYPFLGLQDTRRNYTYTQYRGGYFDL